MRLSIVVPIYNVENYLTKCVDSLLNQNLISSDYEIILVDDGSTDGSGQLVDQYAQANTNVIAIHQTNKGLSGARNTGIRRAVGTYIQFVDSDDFLEPNVLSTLLDKIELEKLDVLQYNYQNVNEAYQIFEPYKTPKSHMVNEGQSVDGLAFLTNKLGYRCYAWQFILRTDIAKSCSFKEGIYFEDTEWTPRMLTMASRVTSIDVVVYNYLMRQGSITQSVSDEKKRKILADKLDLITNLQIQSSDKEDKRWYEGMIASTAISILDFMVKYYYKERQEVLHRFQELSIFPLSYYQSTRRMHRKLVLANMSPLLYVMLMHWRMKL